MTSSRVLVLVGDMLPGATIMQCLQGIGASLDDVDVSGRPPATVQQKYSKAMCLAGAADQVALAALSRCLSPGALVHVHAGPNQQEAVKQNLLLTGFLTCGASDTMVTASMPNYEVGAKSSIKLKAAGSTAAATPAAAAAAAPASSAWTLAADMDDELLDDETLLTEEDRQRPAAAATDDCEVGASGRKACKNCTCGRADAEAKPVKLTQEMLDNPVSSCGNCSLGDAFRCAGCPYRGLPAFEPGKKIELAADFLTADA